MFVFTTEIKALVNGEIKTFAGPNISGVSYSDAQHYCEENGLGYCVVDGILNQEILEDGTVIKYDTWEN